MNALAAPMRRALRAVARPGFATAAAAAAAALWLAGALGYAAGLFGPDVDPQPGGLSATLLLLAALLPLGALIAVAALARETAALRRALAEAMGEAGTRGGAQGARSERRADPRADDGLSPAAARAATEAARAAAAETAKALAARLDRIEGAVARLAAAPRPQAAPTPAPPPPAPAPAPPPAAAAAPQATPRPAPRDDQAALPFAEDRGAPIAWSQVVRALDFPRDEADAEGFAALRAALRDAQIAQLLQASEDVLTFLASAGLHMEDLEVAPAAVADWRAYAQGARGPRAEAIGGVRDPEVIDRVKTRLKGDPIFRDACLVLVRRWNTLVGRIFDEGAEEAAMPGAAGSRTGRAFMLTARAMGAFD